MNPVSINSTVAIGSGCPLALLAGPCVIESEDLVLRTAETIAGICTQLNVPFIFKASYDKANRSSVQSFRGPGRDRGLEMLATVRKELGLPVITDVHDHHDVAAVAEVVDIIQIPAFLCRQTDLLLAAGASGKPVNVKKGQFMSPTDMANITGKITSTGNDNILLTERGTTFGYHNLVVDFRSIPLMQQTGYPVIFDATHSVQLPAAQGTCSGGDREMIPTLAAAAVATGVDALFLEVHPDPDHALCDGANSLPLDHLQQLLTRLLRLWEARFEDAHH
ncbi:MAG: 3-deoxy-8-phosphooctulonate synthase [Deltaproteobacteria bacterium]|nr:3-deoxy-8-phosphooctulonate synthase [Candidatus Anaeroferrophillus wilburensis]MBN2889453.1 3-deoxy-8-phosphooctulonate synthase [Deltaproteobacteria bacterium]